MTYHETARNYVDRLIGLQRHIIKNYPRYDHSAMVNAIHQVRAGFDIYNTKTDTGMRKFWDRYREAIEYLIPSNNHPAQNKLRKEFEELDKNEVLQSVSQVFI